MTLLGIKVDIISKSIYTFKINQSHLFLICRSVVDFLVSFDLKGVRSSNREQTSFESTYSTVEIVITEQWSSKVAFILKQHFSPARNLTTLHDHVLKATWKSECLRLHVRQKHSTACRANSAWFCLSGLNTAGPSGSSLEICCQKKCT